MTAPVTDLIRTLVLQYCPNGSYAAGIASAGAVAHIAVRNLRAWRRRALRPIRLLRRVTRGLAIYAVLIAAGWVVLTTGALPHL